MHVVVYIAQTFKEWLKDTIFLLLVYSLLICFLESRKPSWYVLVLFPAAVPDGRMLVQVVSQHQKDAVGW